MAFAYEVYCYYNVDTLAAVFNGVAAIVNGGAYANLVKSLLTLGVLIMAMVSLSTGKFEGMKWFLVAAIFYVGFLGPKSNVMLVDRVTAQPPVVVANVPLGLAFMAHATSSIGDWMTSTMEANFSVLGNTLKFGQSPTYSTIGETHGLVFGLQLLRETQRAVIADPNLRMDVNEFIRNCTIYDIMAGRVNSKDVVSSTDLMATLATTSVVRLTTVNSLTGTPSTLRCDQAHLSLVSRLNAEADAHAARLGRKLNPNLPVGTTDTAVRTLLNTQVTDMSSLMLGNSSSAQSNLKQNMAINAINDSGAAIGQQLNDPAAVAIAISSAQAEASANSSYRTMAKVAEGAMPKIRNVIEVVIYATFPIVMLIILIAGHRAGAPLKAYFMTMVWLQLWPPLYAVLNLVVTMEAAKQTAAIALASGGTSILSAADIGEVTLSSQAIAGYMVMLIPVIAGAITKGGEQAMSSLASSLTAPTQQAASQAGGQVATGNLSYGNTSLDTHSAHNTSMNSHASSFRMDGGPGAGKITDANGNEIGWTANGRNYGTELKSAFAQTAMVSLDRSKASTRAAEEAHTNSIAQATTVASSFASAYQYMTGSRLSTYSGKDVTMTNGKGETATIDGKSFEHMKNVVQKDAESLSLDQKDVVSFNAALNSGMSAGDALGAVMDNRGLKGQARTGFLSTLAQKTGATGQTAEQVATALQSKLTHTTEGGSQDAYKTLSQLQTNVSNGYQVGEGTGYKKTNDKGETASFTKTQTASKELKQSQADEKKWSQRAAEERKLGSSLSFDALQSPDALKEVGHTPASYLALSQSEKLRVGDQLIRNAEEKYSQFGGSLAPQAEQLLATGPQSNENERNALFEKERKGASAQYKADAPKASAAYSSGASVTQINGAVEVGRNNNQNYINGAEATIAQGTTGVNKEADGLTNKVKKETTDPNLYNKTVELAADSPGMTVAAVGGTAAVVAGTLLDLFPGSNQTPSTVATGSQGIPGYGSPAGGTGSSVLHTASKALHVAGQAGGAFLAGDAAIDMYQHGATTENSFQAASGALMMANPPLGGVLQTTYQTATALGADHLGHNLGGALYDATHSDGATSTGHASETPQATTSTTQTDGEAKAKTSTSRPAAGAKASAPVAQTSTRPDAGQPPPGK